MKCTCGYIGPIEMFRKDGKKCKKCHSQYNKRYYKIKEQKEEKKEIDYSEIMNDEYIKDMAERLGIKLQIKLLKKER